MNLSPIYSRGGRVGLIPTTAFTEIRSTCLRVLSEDVSEKAPVRATILIATEMAFGVGRPSAPGKNPIINPIRLAVLAGSLNAILSILAGLEHDSNRIVAAVFFIGFGVGTVLVVIGSSRRVRLLQLVAIADLLGLIYYITLHVSSVSLKYGVSLVLDVIIVVTSINILRQHQ